MKKSLLILPLRLAAAGLFLPLIAFCAVADSTLTFDFDYARFRMNDSTAAVEVYISVQRKQLKFVEDGGALRASFASTVSIRRGDSTLINHRWSADNVAHHLDEIRPGQLLFTQAQFQISTGDYEIIVRVEDENSKISSAKSAALSIRPFATGALALSDLEFSSMISKDSSASSFNKNNFKVVPNPSALYGTGLPIVYTYSEIYNLSFPSDSTYEMAYRVMDGNGRVVKTTPVKRRPILGSSLVEVNALNIATLRSGSYTLEARVVDHHSGQQALATRKFFVYREEDLAASESQFYGADAIVESYRSLSLAELDAEFDAARYIAENEEKKIFGSLNEDAKRDFLVRFWTRRDQSPETARNEFREQYLARVEYANKNFTGLRSGWKTDMGRVLLIYGVPSEIERIPNSGETRAYQVWKYFEIEGGVEFDFVDIKGWGNYDLVNSTARNELQDSDWERWLRVQ
jgi:GWxTD domain-containing protein